jgi:hypothetical protein
MHYAENRDRQRFHQLHHEASFAIAAWKLLKLLPVTVFS